MFYSNASQSYQSESSNGLSVKVLETGFFVEDTLSHRVQVLQALDNGKTAPVNEEIAFYTVTVENFNSFLQTVEAKVVAS